MKNILLKGIILTTSTAFFISGADISFAWSKKNSVYNGKWVCETNASSASTEVELNADKKMQTQAKSAAAAFDFALKHCRDCSKITCTMEEEKHNKNERTDD